MTVFEINLLRDRAAAPRMRKALFWGVALYLMLCIVALAWLANTTTHRLLRASRLGRQLDVAEQSFQSTRQRSENVLEFAERAERRLEMDAQSLECIEKVIRNRISLVSVITSLTAALPPGVDLLKLNLDGKKDQLTFAVVVPEGSAARQVGGGRLAAVWNADGTLQKRLGRIRAVSTRRDRVDARTVMVMQFAADVK